VLASSSPGTHCCAGSGAGAGAASGPADSGADGTTGFGVMRDTKRARSIPRSPATRTSATVMVSS